MPNRARYSPEDTQAGGSPSALEIVIQVERAKREAMKAALKPLGLSTAAYYRLKNEVAEAGQVPPEGIDVGDYVLTIHEEQKHVIPAGAQTLAPVRRIVLHNK